MKHEAQLESFYADHLENDFTVVDEDAEREIVVRAYDTSAAGPKCTLATFGMSRVAMNAPEDRDACSRAELVSYAPSSEREFVWWLSWAAAFLFIDNTWLGHGHTIWGGEPLFGDSALRHLLRLSVSARRYSVMPSASRLRL